MFAHAHKHTHLAASHTPNPVLFFRGFYSFLFRSFSLDDDDDEGKNDDQEDGKEGDEPSYAPPPSSAAGKKKKKKKRQTLPPPSAPPPKHLPPPSNPPPSDIKKRQSVRKAKKEGSAYGGEDGYSNHADPTREERLEPAGERKSHPIPLHVHNFTNH